jgi:hypothetical protein
MAGDKQVICAKREAEYFFGEGWTDRNSLIRLEKFDFARKSDKPVACATAVLVRLFPRKQGSCPWRFLEQRSDSRFI